MNAGINGIDVSPKPMFLAYAVSGFSWTSTSPIQWQNPVFDTHNFFDGAARDRFRIPVAGVYSILVTVQWSLAAVESEWAICNTNTYTGTSILARCYTGYGAYNGQFIDVIAPFKENEFLFVCQPRSGVLQNTVPYASYVCARWLAPFGPGVALERR